MLATGVLPDALRKILEQYQRRLNRNLGPRPDPANATTVDRARSSLGARCPRRWRRSVVRWESAAAHHRQA
jgi:hypothetical protein